MANPAEWLLCVDESGDFNTPADRVCAGGLLLQEADSPLLTSKLRARLSLVFPHLPYPPHAADYNHPSLHLAAWHQLSPDSRQALPLELRKSLERAGQLLLAAEEAPPELMGAPLGTPLPTHLVLSRRDALLRNRAPEAHGALQSVLLSIRLRMNELLQELTRLYPERCLLAVAAEPSGIPMLPTGGDRYLGLLGALFTRVIQLLRLRGGPVRLTLRVASRWVRRASGMGPLGQTDVRQALDAALRASGAGVNVYPVILKPEDYDGRVHPGIVLADHALNRTRALLGAPTWDRLAQGVSDATGLPSELGVPGGTGRLPAITAQGLTPGWVPEQEKRWLSYLEAPERMRRVE